MKLYLAELLTGKSAIKNQTAGESALLFGNCISA
jgi:hypothetical protein